MLHHRQPPGTIDWPNNESINKDRHNFTKINYLPEILVGGLN